MIYLSSARRVPIDGFRLFMSTMEASGQPKVAYEGSWAALNSNGQRLFEVLLTVYRQHRILVVLDAFEHNLEDGEMRPQVVRSFVEAFLLADHASKLLITTRGPPLLSPDEAGVVQEIPLDGGLPVADSLLLLMGQIPAAVSVSPERLEAAVQAANGIPFMIERLGFLVREHRVRNVSRPAAHEDALDEFVKLAHSTLSVHARMTLQGRAVFDEPVPDEALAFVLAPEVAPVDVESAIRELGQGKFLFPVGSSGLLLGIHELDQESSYRSLAREGLIDRRLLHRRAADYYARSCGERAHWFEWTSNDELKSDIQRFRHLIRAGDTVAAANAMSISKVEFLVWSGHADTIHSMFADLDVGDGDTRAALIKHFALGDALLVSGPFEKAISELKRAIDLAQSLGEAVAEAEATIELGLAYRYVGKSELALSTVHSMIEKLRERGEKRQLAYANSSYSLACTYTWKYVEAIQAGTEQVHYGRHSGESYLVGRGNSCLCLPYVCDRSNARRCALCQGRSEDFGKHGCQLPGWVPRECPWVGVARARRRWRCNPGVRTGARNRQDYGATAGGGTGRHELGVGTLRARRHRGGGIADCGSDSRVRQDQRARRAPGTSPSRSVRVCE